MNQEYILANYYIGDPLPNNIPLNIPNIYQQGPNFLPSDGVWKIQSQWIKPTPIDRTARLYFSLGVQRSGKSTLARKWLRREISFNERGAETLQDDGYPRFVWDTDLLRKVVTGKAWHFESEPLMFAIKSLVIRVTLESGSDVFVAGTHTSRPSIRRMLEIRREAIPIVVDTDLETCLQRAMDTDQAYLLHVIPRVHRQLRSLLEDGLFQTIQSILIDMDCQEPY